MSQVPGTPSTSLLHLPLFEAHHRRGESVGVEFHQLTGIAGVGATLCQNYVSIFRERVSVKWKTNVQLARSTAMAAGEAEACPPAVAKNAAFEIRGRRRGEREREVERSNSGMLRRRCGSSPDFLLKLVVKNARDANKRCSTETRRI